MNPFGKVPLAPFLGFRFGQRKNHGMVRTDGYIHGHRTLKAPHPVRSAQLTRVPLS